MDNLPLILLALACPIGMVLMMMLMGRGMMSMGNGAHPKDPAATATGLAADPDERLAVLQEQRQLLDAQIAAAEQPKIGRAAPDQAKP